MGRIEYKNELGMMKTDFTMIKPEPFTKPMAAI